MIRTRYMCMNIEGFLRNSRFPDDYAGVFTNDDGTPVPASDAYADLIDRLRQGHHLMPMKSECSNPCQQPGCAGFDYGKNGGCPGFETID